MACDLQKAAWPNRDCYLDLSLNPTLALAAKRVILEKHPACLALKRLWPVACRHSRTARRQMHTVP